jgi:hypothetical protein
MTTRLARKKPHLHVGPTHFLQDQIEPQQHYPQAYSDGYEMVSSCSYGAREHIYW